MAVIDDYKAARVLAVAEFTQVNPKGWSPGAAAYFFEDDRDGLAVPISASPPGDLARGQGGPGATAGVNSPDRADLILHYLLHASGALSPAGASISSSVPGRILLVGLCLPGQKAFAGDLRP